MRCISVNCYLFPTVIGMLLAPRVQLPVLARIRALAAKVAEYDLVLVQECWGHRNQADLMSAMRAHGFEHFILSEPTSRWSGGIGAGLVVASRRALYDMQYVAASGGYNEEIFCSKGAILFRVHAADDAVFANLHLVAGDARGPMRADQMGRIVAAMQAAYPQSPALMVGDFNQEDAVALLPSHLPHGPFTRCYPSAPRFTDYENTSTIDHVLRQDGAPVVTRVTADRSFVQQGLTDHAGVAFEISDRGQADRAKNKQI